MSVVISRPRLTGVSRVRKVLLFTLLLLALAAAGVAQTPAVQPSEARRESFDIVWRTVNEKHFDPTFGGVDWDGVRRKYEPRLNQIKTDAELYDMLDEMLGELHQSHFGIIPPEAITAESREAATGGVGLDLRLIDERAVITRVDADAPAARAGLRSGFVITKVDDLPVAQVVGQLRKNIAGPAMARLYTERRVLAHINGKPATPV